MPLAESGCAATLDLQIKVGALGKRIPGFCDGAGPCGPYRVWQSAPNLGSLTCVYDSSGQRLISSTSCTDFNAYCDGKDNCFSGGLGINVFTVCDVAKLPTVCPPTDAGSD